MKHHSKHWYTHFPLFIHKRSVYRFLPIFIIYADNMPFQHISIC